MSQTTTNQLIDKPGYTIRLNKNGNQQYYKIKEVQAKQPKEGYHIIVDKNGNERYMKDQTAEQKQQMIAKLQEGKKNKYNTGLNIQGIKKKEVNTIIEDAHRLDRNEMKTIRQRLDELKDIVKSVVPKAVERTQSAPKVVEPQTVIQQQMKEIAERPIIQQAHEQPKKNINPNLAKYGIY